MRGIAHCVYCRPEADAIRSKQSEAVNHKNVKEDKGSPSAMGSDENEKTAEALDNETGEICQAVICLRSKRSDEQEVSRCQSHRTSSLVRRQKKSFHVPISYVQRKQEEDKEVAGVILAEGRFGDEESRRKKKVVWAGKQRKRLRVECIEESVVEGTQDVSPIVFMLPTVLIFPAWASIVCVLCEACLHMLSHKRNKMKKYQTEYKSPLHVISSEFCGYCRSRRWKEKIKQIQEKRFMRRKFACRNVVAH